MFADVTHKNPALSKQALAVDSKLNLTRMLGNFPPSFGIFSNR